MPNGIPALLFPSARLAAVNTGKAAVASRSFMGLTEWVNTLTITPLLAARRVVIYHLGSRRTEIVVPFSLEPLSDERRDADQRISVS